MVRLSNALPNFTGRKIHGRYLLQDVLGTGAYGVVHRAIDMEAGPCETAEFAVKCLLNSDLLPGHVKSRTEHRREIALHKSISKHPNILTLHSVIYEDEYVFLVVDLLDGGDLFRAIVAKRSFWRDDELLRSVFLKICDGLLSMHSKGIAHRDLKPENILCSEDGSKVVIADFGLASLDILAHEFGCGSAFYMSPECIGEENDYQPYCPLRSDIWSLGIILVNLVTGRNPWHQARSDDQCFSTYLNDQYLGQWQGLFLREMLPISVSLNHLLNRILAVEPEDRLSIEEIQEEVRQIDTFFMSPEDIASGTSHVKMTAEFYAKPRSSLDDDFDDERYGDAQLLEVEVDEEEYITDDEDDGDEEGDDATLSVPDRDIYQATPPHDNITSTGLHRHRHRPSDASSATSSNGPHTPPANHIDLPPTAISTQHRVSAAPVREPVAVGAPFPMFDKLPEEAPSRYDSGGRHKRRTSSLSDVFKHAMRRLRALA